MKMLGLVLVATGLCGLLVALNLDTTVEVPGQPGKVIEFGKSWDYIPSVPSQRVNNIGLMDQRRNWLIVSGIVVSGILLFGLSEITNAVTRTPPSDALSKRKAAQKPS